MQKTGTFQHCFWEYMMYNFCKRQFDIADQNIKFQVQQVHFFFYFLVAILHLVVLWDTWSPRLSRKRTEGIEEINGLLARERYTISPLRLTTTSHITQSNCKGDWKMQRGCVDYSMNSRHLCHRGPMQS